MGSLRIVPIFLLLASAALAQTYGVGRAPTAAELAEIRKAVAAYQAVFDTH